MFIPVRDDNPLVFIRYPYVTAGLLVLTTAVFVLVQGTTWGGLDEAQALSFGVVPAVLFDLADLAPELQIVPAAVTPITYLFFHGGWLHFLANMLFLWVFADNVEDMLGHARFLLFYLLCGIASALIHAFVVPASQDPMIGASGAIAGVIGAYFVMFPTRKVWILLFFGLPMKIPAIAVLGVWIATQVLYFATGHYGDTEVAWVAHISGFLVGMILVVVMRRRIGPAAPGPSA